MNFETNDDAESWEWWRWDDYDDANDIMVIDNDKMAYDDREMNYETDDDAENDDERWVYDEYLDELYCR